MSREPGSADGRFAPSPTGTLHLGNLRTALLAWLYARSQASRFLVRIEDLDAGRSRPHFVGEQLGDLRTLGLDWDGDVVHQSQRGAHYEAALAQLDAAGLLYPCYCTRAEIRAAASAPHGEEPHYAGTCRTLSRAEQKEREASGRPPALRVRADGATVTVHDRNHGPVTGVVDDLVVRRNDGGHAYNLAVVVDDAAQGIGEVVRGDDLLSATPGQVWLQRALGLPTPAYAHVPLLRGDDGDRLAKRHGAVTLGERLAAGETAGQVRATLLASVGLPIPDGPGATMQDALDAFEPTALVA